MNLSLFMKKFKDRLANYPEKQNRNYRYEPTEPIDDDYYMPSEAPKVRNFEGSRPSQAAPSYAAGRAEVDYVGKGQGNKDIFSFYPLIPENEPEVSIIETEYPSDVYRDCPGIVAYLKKGIACIVSLEGVDKWMCQRITDFTGGALCYCDGEMRQITQYVWVAAPRNFDIMGNLKEITHATQNITFKKTSMNAR
jgi:FtsZ-interacting cell division protein YlmF